MWSLQLTNAVKLKVFLEQFRRMVSIRDQMSDEGGWCLGSSICSIHDTSIFTWKLTKAFMVAQVYYGLEHSTDFCTLEQKKVLHSGLILL